MAVYKPTYTDKKTGERKQSDVWWYEFMFNGERIRESSKQRNKRTAQRIEAARHAQLAKGDVQPLAATKRAVKKGA